MDSSDAPTDDTPVKSEQPSPRPVEENVTLQPPSASKPESKSKSRKNENNDTNTDASKRRCVSTACIACRKRKSKCDGNIPACAACSSVYGTECVYDPNSDHRRKGVYKKDIDSLKTRNSTLQTLIQALLNTPEDEVLDLVQQIRTCESLDKVADGIVARQKGQAEAAVNDEQDITEEQDGSNSPTFESQLSSKMGTLKLEDGTVRYIGGTSNLLFLTSDEPGSSQDEFDDSKSPGPSWTTVTNEVELINHLLNHYFTWHYTFFTILPKAGFYRHFLMGKPARATRKKHEYCSSLLVNTILALGCHFTSHPGSRADPDDSSTAGDHFFREAKRILFEEDELSKPSLANVQALALMSVREAGCAREAQGFAYSGMAFRMATELGLSFQTGAGLTMGYEHSPDDNEEDSRRITFWGCFQIDKCWSNYLGRLPQFQLSANVTIPRFDVFPDEEAGIWTPYTDSGFNQAHSQPSRVRAVALQISFLCEISSDLIKHFYYPQMQEKAAGKHAEMKKLSEVHGRLEDWRRNLPKELEPKEGTLSSIIVMHMFFQLLYIHLFRYFLKYNETTSPLPAHISPRKICTQAAGMISKLLRLYKRSHGLRQIVNFAVYIAHSACTIHLLNLPDKTAKRDMIHGVKHLEEMAEAWLAARRTLRVLSVQARNWKVELPEEAAAVLARTDMKFGPESVGKSPVSTGPQVSPTSPTSKQAAPQQRGHHVQQQHDRQPQPQSFQDPSAWQRQPDLYQLNGAMFGNDVQSANGIQPLQQRFSPTTMGLNHQPFVGSPLQYSSPATQSDRSTTNFKQRQPSAIQSQAQTPHSHNTPTLQQLNQSPQLPHQLQFQQPQMASTQQSLKRSLLSNDPFGGVEALLREGQDWFIKDPALDLAAGFGNWNNQQRGLASGSNTLLPYGTKLDDTDSWVQQQQRQQHSEQISQQQQIWQQQQQRQQMYANQINDHRKGSVMVESMSLSGPDDDAAVYDNGSRIATGAVEHTGLPSDPQAASDLNGYGYGMPTNNYNEEDWYQ